MDKFELVNGEIVEKEVIDLNNLLVVKIFSVIDEKGYLTKRELYNIFKKYGLLDYDRYSCYFKIDKIKKIIIKKPNNYGTPRYVREFLTDVKFPYVGIDEDLYRSPLGEDNYYIKTKHKELNTFVFSKYYNNTHPSIEELWKYIEEHKDIDVYRTQLESIDSRGRIIYNEKKKEEAKVKKLVKKRL